tara:strand:+ start:221 stop:589 length:369 start_codon:yes stop_codon:yes gene_type:complete
MTREFKRTDRVAQTILRNLAQIIHLELTDHRISGMLTLTEVEVSKDLNYAKVYFTVFQDDPAKVTAILNAASNFLRTQLSKTMKLRTTPHLRFIFDESIEYSQNLSRLIDNLNTGDDEDESD